MELMTARHNRESVMWTAETMASGPTSVLASVGSSLNFGRHASETPRPPRPIIRAPSSGATVPVLGTLHGPGPPHDSHPGPYFDLSNEGQNWNLREQSERESFISLLLRSHQQVRQQGRGA